MTDQSPTTELPPYVIEGERDWRDSAKALEGPLSHPYGFDAWCVVEPEETGRVRVFPNRDDAVPYMQECGYV